MLTKILAIVGIALLLIVILAALGCKIICAAINQQIGDKEDV